MKCSLYGKIVRVSVMSAISLSLAACSNVPSFRSDEEAKLSRATPTSTKIARILVEPGYKLLVDIPQAERFNGIVEVDANGMIHHHALGPLTIAGVDIAAAEQMIADAIQRDRQLQPRVYVHVLNYQPIRISGEVVNTGQYPYILGLNLAHVLEEAGGLTYRADSKRAFVTERKTGDKREVRIHEGTILKPGDHILIPQRYF